VTSASSYVYFVVLIRRYFDIPQDVSTLSLRAYAFIVTYCAIVLVTNNVRTIVKLRNIGHTLAMDWIGADWGGSLERARAKVHCNSLTCGVRSLAMCINARSVLSIVNPLMHVYLRWIWSKFCRMLTLWMVSSFNFLLFSSFLHEPFFFQVNASPTPPHWQCKAWAGVHSVVVTYRSS